MQNPADDESPTLERQRELTALLRLTITNTYSPYRVFLMLNHPQMLTPVTLCFIANAVVLYYLPPSQVPIYGASDPSNLCTNLPSLTIHTRLAEKNTHTKQPFLQLMVTYCFHKKKKKKTGFTSKEH